MKIIGDITEPSALITLETESFSHVFVTLITLTLITMTLITLSHELRVLSMDLDVLH